MRKRFFALCLLVLALSSLTMATACATSGGKQALGAPQSPIEAARDQAAPNSQGEVSSSATALAQDKLEGDNAIAESRAVYSDDQVDIDLTAMSGTAVYSAVYQMLVEPDTYRDQVVKIEGIYYSQYDDHTKNRYYFVIVPDATACCAQGIEFVWDDGSHVYPDDYPVDGSQVVVTGVYGTYTERSSKFNYLRDCSVQLAS